MAANGRGLPPVADCWLPCASNGDCLLCLPQLIPTCHSPLALAPVLPRVWKVLLQAAVPTPLTGGGPESLWLLLFSSSFLALLLPFLQWKQTLAPPPFMLPPSTMRGQAWDAVEMGPVSSGVAKQKAVGSGREAEEEWGGSPDHIQSSLARRASHLRAAPLPTGGHLCPHCPPPAPLPMFLTQPECTVSSNTVVPLH